MTQPYDTPLPTGTYKSNKHKNATEMVDYTTIIDQLRAVSWRHYNHINWLVNRVSGQSCLLPANVMLYKEHPFINF